MNKSHKVSNSRYLVSKESRWHRSPLLSDENLMYAKEGETAKSDEERNEDMVRLPAVRRTAPRQRY